MCKGISSILKSIVNALKPILTIALLAAAAYFLFIAPAGATLAGTFSGISWMPAVIAESALSVTTAGYIALGAAVVLNPEGVAQVTSSVAEGVGSIAGAVLSGVATGLVQGSSIGTWALYGALAWFFLFRKDSKDETYVDRKLRRSDEREEAEHKRMLEAQRPMLEAPQPMLAAPQPRASNS